jgi:hypothetical protein
MSTTRCKIPIGSFYGHVVILPGECYPETSEVQGLSESNIQVRSVDLAKNVLPVIVAEGLQVLPTLLLC